MFLRHVGNDKLKRCAWRLCCSRTWSRCSSIMFAHLSCDKAFNTMMNDYSLSSVCPFQITHDLGERRGFVVQQKLSFGQVAPCLCMKDKFAWCFFEASISSFVMKSISRHNFVPFKSPSALSLPLQIKDTEIKHILEATFSLSEDGENKASCSRMQERKKVVVLGRCKTCRTGWVIGKAFILAVFQSSYPSKICCSVIVSIS